MPVEPSKNRPSLETGSVSDEQIKKLVDAISRSQHNHRDLIDNLDQAVFTLSLEGEVRVANRRLSELLGVPFPDLIGHLLTEFVEVADSSKSALADFLSKGFWKGTVPVRLKRENTPRYFECWFQAVADGGEVSAVTGWARDVTRERDSELFFTEFFQSLREGVFFTTLDGQILDANPALIQMFGFDSKEEFLARNFREFYDDPLSRNILMRDIPSSSDPHWPMGPVPIAERELVFRRKDGKRLYCLGSGFAIKDRSNDTVRVQGVLFDITERREIENKLRQEQEFVRRLVASFPDMITVLDRDARFAFVSQRVNEYTGISPQEFIGKPLGWRSKPEDRERLLQIFNEVMSGHSANPQIEFRSQHADGKWRILRLSASPLFDESGKISGVVSSAHDVTEAKQAEQQLAEKEKFAAMGQMMAGAAHELNNPLTAILGVSELLRERTEDEAARRHLELVLQQARRAAGIVQNLLAFSRPPAQGRTLVRVEMIVEAALEQHKPNLAKKNITCTVEVAPNLPSVEAEPRLLTQVFSNLISNAEHAIAARGEQGRLSLTIRSAMGEVQVNISDDGVGIPAANLGKVFDPFFTTKRPGGGSGLGLTICMAVIKEHGGSIEVQSAAEGGTTFRICLPAAIPGHAQAPSALGSDATNGDKSTSLRGHTVLVVDDEESIREIVQDGLEARGMSVYAVGSSEAALDYFGEHKCEIVVCDSHLPGLSGEQLFDKLQARLGSATPRFVFMTGDLVDSAAVAKYQEKGARLLQKPFNVAGLAKLLSEVLQPARAV